MQGFFSLRALTHRVLVLFDIVSGPSDLDKAVVQNSSRGMAMALSSAVSSSYLRKFIGLSLTGWLILTIPATAEPFRAADVLKTIYAFKGGADGSAPVSGLTLGPKNTLYGATGSTVFQLKEKSNGKWTETPISTTSLTSLIGTSTALYGVIRTDAGKTCKGYEQGCGEVIELTPPVTGTTWKQKVIYAFKAGKDGALPVGIAVAPNGDIYGTTSAGGNASACGSDNGIADGCGTLFQLAKSKNKWTETVLHRFKGGADGELPFAAPSFDAAGNVYGSTNQGGSSNSNSARGTARDSCDGTGTVFAFNKTGLVLADLWFSICDAEGPAFADAVITTLANGELTPPPSAAPSAFANLSASRKAANGAIFTTEGGGHANECAPLDNNGCGVVAELAEPANGKTPWSLKILHEFDSKDGALPNGNLVANGDDTLYGVATYGGSNSSTCQTETFGKNGCGVLYKLVKKGSDWAWAGAIYKFPGGAHGAGPNGELLSHKGKIYGMTAEGGSTACGNGGCGTIFQLTP
jgi:hypothetical protein